MSEWAWKCCGNCHLSDKCELKEELVGKGEICEKYSPKAINEELDFVQEHKKIPVNLQIIKQEPKTEWIPVSKRLPELNKPLLVTSYHRVYYGHLISESGNYGYPVFRIHGLGDKNRDWVQETMSHEPYSLGRIDAWMYLTIPEPYKESEG